MNNKTFSSVKCDDTTFRNIRDALETLSGNWKLSILLTLSTGPKRFREIAKQIEGISDKMLSKELKNLENHLLVKRTVLDTYPPVAKYEVTGYIESLVEVLAALNNWGSNHRRKITGK
jgi:DNA-binding HxlR family transcriptional regulator